LCEIICQPATAIEMQVDYNSYSPIILSDRTRTFDL